MRIAVILHNQIKEVCPITGVSVFNPEDKRSWRIYFKPEATEEQKIAARNIVADFVYNESSEAEYTRKIMMREKQKDPIAKVVFAMYQAQNPDATFEEFMQYAENL